MSTSSRPQMSEMIYSIGPQGQRNSGVMLVYGLLMLMTMLAFGSLAIDFGRAQVAKLELQRSAESAARYGATGIFDNTYLSKAQAAAAQNSADGSSVSLTSSE